MPRKAKHRGVVQVIEGLSAGEGEALPIVDDLGELFTAEQRAKHEARQARHAAELAKHRQINVAATVRELGHTHAREVADRLCKPQLVAPATPGRGQIKLGDRLVIALPKNPLRRW